MLLILYITKICYQNTHLIILWLNVGEVLGAFSTLDYKIKDIP